MKKQILFIQGGGEDGYNADLRMVDSLKQGLGSGFEIVYPRLPSDEAAPDFGWIRQIEIEINSCNNGVTVVAHSLGASMLLKYLSENEVAQEIAAVFLIAVPYWHGDEDWKQGLKLREDFSSGLPEALKFYFYHCKDDEEVPFKHLSYYRENLPFATFIELDTGGHHLNNDLSLVARDIKDYLR